MGKLSEQQVSDAKEAFTLFDKDGDGCITTGELGTVIRALGKNPTEAEVAALVREVDPDGRGIIDFNEFLGVMARDIRSYDNEDDLKNAWKVFDKENLGFVNSSELRHVLTNIGEKLGTEEIDELLREADPENNGKIMYDQFVKVLMAK